MLNSPLKVIQGEDFEEQAQELYETFNQLLDTFSPDTVIIERFQNRGFVRGAQGEVVTFMSSMLCTLCRNKQISHRLIMASTWKTAAKRIGLDLDKAYARGKKSKVVPHRIDAAMIALYGHLGGFSKGQLALLKKTSHAARTKL
jgi:hypothetical protein